MSALEKTNARRPASRWEITVVALSVVAASVVGCNSILDNNPGTLVATDEAGVQGDPNPPVAPEDAAPADTGSAQDAAPDASEPPSPDCPLGQHICNGVCVSLVDPVYGCGDPSCMPCASSHSTMGCQGRTCIVAACDPGYANCNAMAGDGCETDLSKPDTCGACNAACGVATPLCQATGATFQCTNGCTPATPVNCGNTCVDPNSNINNCGACNVKCPVVANSTTTCTTGTCGFTCKAAFHACGGKCPAKTDPTACGPACTVCPVPTGGAATCTADVCGISCTAPSHVCSGKCVTNDPTACGAACTPCVAPANATATCAAETCGFACLPNFGNCDANAANGCETDLTGDNANCGTCGNACGALKKCTAGVCQPIAP